MANWTVVGATLAVIGVAVGLHYLMLVGCARQLPTAKSHRSPRVILTIFVVLAAHTAEIYLFAFAYYGLAHFEALGAIRSVPAGAVLSLGDYAYFSASAYTTLGFGDLIPSGPIRFMVGMEALTGLVMITWSASFTFLEMQRHWRAET